MWYEMKIVNRAATAMKKFHAAGRAVDEARERERTIFLPRFRANTRWLCTLLFLRSLSFFFHESVKRAQFRRGIFIGVDSSALYPFVTVPSAFYSKFFIQMMLKYTLCTQYNTAKNELKKFYKYMKRVSWFIDGSIALFADTNLLCKNSICA